MEKTADMKNLQHLIWKRGKIKEIDDISVDHFKGSENLTSVVYFVSHCHSDHMEGLSEENTFQCALLERSEVYIYSSAVSVKILEAKYPKLKARLRELDVYRPNYIPIPRTEKLMTVTLISAGHCPGSVMFLFEYDNKKILYTGDFRIKPTDLKKFNAFLDDNNELKPIDNIYLDTTFFNKQFSFFPTRQQTVDEICKVIRKWIRKGPKFVAVIKTPAYYAYEHLIMEVSRNLTMRVNVTHEMYDVYKYIPEMDNCITLDERNTQIYVRFRRHYFDDSNRCVKSIFPSAMTWRNLNDDKDFFEDEYNTCKICYATHSSYTEIVEFLDYIKPKNVVACVLPYQNKEDMLQHLDEITRKYRNVDRESSSDDEIQLTPEWLKHDAKPVNILSTPKKNREEVEDDYLIDRILDSPERPKRMKL